MTTQNEVCNLDFFVDWLRKKISEITGKSPNAIDEKVPLTNYGLDSLHAVTLSGEIEAWLNIDIDPTIAWDYPTITEMAAYLQDETKQMVTN